MKNKVLKMCKNKMCDALIVGALKTTEANVNATCMYVAHQPSLPKEAKKLRKF